MKNKKRKASIYSWRPRAKTRDERMAQALKTHHRRPRVPGTKCEVPTCVKFRLMGSPYCARHAPTRQETIIDNQDAIAYGE